MNEYIRATLIACVAAKVVFMIADCESVPVYANVVEPIAVEQSIEVEPEIQITDGERDLLAAIVFAEANTEPLEGKQLVVDVILNRAENEKFPNSITAVIFEPGQFWTRGLPNNYESIPADCYEAVDAEVMSRLNHEVLYFRTGNYHSFGTAVTQVGHHFFSK